MLCELAARDVTPAHFHKMFNLNVWASSLPRRRRRQFAGRSIVNISLDGCQLLP